MECAICRLCVHPRSSSAASAALVCASLFLGAKGPTKDRPATSTVALNHVATLSTWYNGKSKFCFWQCSCRMDLWTPAAGCHTHNQKNGVLTALLDCHGTPRLGFWVVSCSYHRFPIQGFDGSPRCRLLRVFDGAPRLQHPTKGQSSLCGSRVCVSRLKRCGLPLRSCRRRH